MHICKNIRIIVISLGETIMNELDLHYICTVISNLSGIPIRLYRNDEQIFYHALIRLPRDPMLLHKESLWLIQSHVGYFVTDDFHYYGIVNSGSVKIILGPTRQVPASSQELRKMAFDLDVPSTDADVFVSNMKNIVPMPLESVMQILCTVNYILNGEKLELQDIAIYEEEQNDLKRLLKQQQASQTLSTADSDVLPGQGVHTTYELEQNIMNIVRHGDTAALRSWISSAPAVRGGILAADQLRQLKNTFIVTTTLVSRAAIQGGVETEEAFTLSDAYIQKCELLNRPERILNLQYHMILEFTERVEQLHTDGQSSELVIAVTRYIQRHLSEPISTEAIAQELYLTRPYLSQKFKKETGLTLTDFIMQQKTQEAKRLLRYTDKSISTIGSFLGFSSQSHFSRVFQKYAGCRPKEYRNLHNY